MKWDGYNDCFYIIEDCMNLDINQHTRTTAYQSTEKGQTLVKFDETSSCYQEIAL